MKIMGIFKIPNDELSPYSILLSTGYILNCRKLSSEGNTSHLVILTAIKWILLAISKFKMATAMLEFLLEINRLTDWKLKTKENKTNFVDFRCKRTEVITISKFKMAPMLDAYMFNT